MILMKYDIIFHMDGFIFLDKNAGVMSSKADGDIKHLFNTARVGHVGTLDPFATGLLILGVNKATKGITFFDDFDKEYVATIKLGIETDSMDLDGKEIYRKDVPSLSKDKITEVLNSFLGKSKQLPPMTSAIKIDGVALYKLAHKGREIDRPLRDIEVHEIELIDYKEDTLTFRALVSKGTYMRVLGSDIARKLGTVGHLSFLRRTKVGPFSVTEASKIEDISDKSLKSTYEVLSRFCSTISFDDKKIKDIKDGKIKILEGSYPSDKLLVVDSSSNVVAMYKKTNNNKYEFARGLF